LQTITQENPKIVAESKGFKFYTEGAATAAYSYAYNEPDEISDNEIEDKFDFIEDDKLKEILVRDFRELEICRIRGLNKSTLVICGSIIEALLIDQILKEDNLPLAQEKFNDNIKKKRPDRIDKLPQEWFFAEIIDVCKNLNLISDESKKDSWRINEYRNIIHPMNEISQNKNISPELAEISYNILLLIIKDISSLEKTGS